MFLARRLKISFATTQTIAIYVCASPPSKKLIFFLQLLKNGCLSAATCPANQWFILNQAKSFGSDKSLSVSTKDALSSCSTRAALNMEPTVMGWRGSEVWIYLIGGSNHVAHLQPIIFRLSSSPSTRGGCP